MYPDDTFQNSKKYWEYEVNKMKKKIILRSIFGFPIGITIGYLITIFISLGWANGYYTPCVPELVNAMGSEINAVVLQTLLCGLMGAGFAASSAISAISFLRSARSIFLIASYAVKSLHPLPLRKSLFSLLISAHLQTHNISYIFPFQYLK